MSDISEIISQVAYNKTGRVNAACNQNEDFQSGFRFGTNKPKLETSTGIADIANEFERRGSPERFTAEFSKFEEWKRGYWAGTFQSLFADRDAICGGDGSSVARFGI